MRLSELKNAGRSPSLPLSIPLADAAGPADLQLLSLLRVLPGQRDVGAGVWREELMSPSPAHAAKHEVTTKKNNQRGKRFVMGAIIKVSPSGVKQSRDFYASATP